MGTKYNNKHHAKFKTPEMISGNNIIPEKEDIYNENEYALSNYPIQLIPANKLISSPPNIKQPNVGELQKEKSFEFVKKSILYYGFLQPLVVTPVNKTEKYQVLAGDNYLAAFKSLQREKKIDGLYESGLPCYIIAKEVSPLKKELILANVSTSEHNKDCISQFKEYIHLVNLYNEAQKDGIEVGARSRDEFISQHLKIKKRMMQNYNAIGKLLPEFLDMFRNGTLGCKLASAIGAKPEDVQQEILLLVNKKNLNPQSAYEAINKVYQQEKASNAKRRKQIESIKKEVKSLNKRLATAPHDYYSIKRKEELRLQIDMVVKEKDEEKSSRGRRIDNQIKESKTPNLNPVATSRSSASEVTTVTLLADIKNNMQNLRFSGPINIEDCEVIDTLADIYKLSRRYLSLSGRGKALILEEEKHMPVAREGINNSNESGEFIV